MNSSVAERTMTERQEAERAQCRAWIERILTAKNWTPTDLARQADIAPSTITRFLKDEENTHSLSFSTIKKICDGAQTDIPDVLMQAYGARRKVPDAVSRQVSPTGDLGPSTVKLVRISSLPDGVIPMVRTTARVPRPAKLMHDQTAFAVHMPDKGLGQLIPEQSLLFLTRVREPSRGDLAMITDNRGVSRVRLVKATGPEGVTLIEKGNEEIRIPRDHIKDYGVVSVIERP